jgi:hypothetical protein
MKKLYVDRIIENGNTGVTQDRDNITYNCDLIKDGIIDQLTDQLTTSDHATTVKIAGRYICIITLSLSDKSIMIIKNLGRDENELKDILNDIDSGEMIQFVTLAFQALKNDDSEYYDFELEVGTPPR